MTTTPSRRKNEFEVGPSHVENVALRGQQPVEAVAVANVVAEEVEQGAQTKRLDASVSAVQPKPKSMVERALAKAEAKKAELTHKPKHSSPLSLTVQSAEPPPLPPRHSRAGGYGVHYQPQAIKAGK